MARSTRALVFMAKWPEPGRAKTRLCPPLSAAQAAELARAFLLDTLAEAARTANDIWIAYAPASAAAKFRGLVGADVGLIPAETADFGAALFHAQRSTLCMGYREVALVASDVPHLPRERYLEAFDAVEVADVAIGPSGDGGYYLLASRDETPALFRDVTWSTPAVYQQTLERAQREGLGVASLEACDDVDTAVDLGQLLRILTRRPGEGHTLEQLRRLSWLVEGTQGIPAGS